MGLDDSVALPPGQRLAVGPARPAVTAGPRLATAETAPGGGAAASIGIGPARVVSVAADGGPPAGAPESPPPSAPPAPAAVPVAVPPEPAAPQAAPATPDREAAELGARHPGPSAAGLGELGGDEGEAGEADDEEGAGGADDEDECAPPFHLLLGGTWHELVLCREAQDEGGGFHLLLDGEPIDVEAWLEALREDDSESSEAVVP